MRGSAFLPFPDCALSLGPVSDFPTLVIGAQVQRYRLVALKNVEDEIQ